MKIQKSKFEVDDVVSVKPMSPLVVGIVGQGVIVEVKANGYYTVKFSCRNSPELIHERHLKLFKRPFFSLKRLMRKI